MATTTPTLTLSLVGDTYVTQLSKQKTWTPGAKIEQNYVISDTDGNQVIDLSLVDSIQSIVFVSSSAFKVSITAGGQQIVFAVSGFFVFDPTSTFLGTVTELAISTDSTTDITVQVRVYGGS